MRKVESRKLKVESGLGAFAASFQLYNFITCNLASCADAVVQPVGKWQLRNTLIAYNFLPLPSSLRINHFLYSFYPLQARILFHKVFRFSTEVIGRVVPTIHRPNKGSDKIYIHNYLIQGVEEA